MKARYMSEKGPLNRMILAVCLMLMAGLVQAKTTLDAEDYIGTWYEHHGMPLPQSAEELAGIASGTLTISADFNFTFTREISYDLVTFSATAEDVLFGDGLMVITFPADENGRYITITLQGWHAEEGARLFGSLYFHDGASIENAYPLTFSMLPVTL